jgi:hypothetical protein
MCICVVKQLHDTFCTKQNHSSLFNVCRSVCLLYNVKTSFSLGRNKRTDVRKMAYRSLSDNLNPLILTYVRRKRFHQILLEELPWRAQMNLYLANAHFHLFLQKLTERTKERLGSSYSSVRYRMMLVPSPPHLHLLGLDWAFVCSRPQFSKVVRMSTLHWSSLCFL